MIKKLLEKFNVEIEIVNIKNKPSYYGEIRCCRVCKCPLFPDEIMCPDCLTPRP